MSTRLTRNTSCYAWFRFSGYVDSTSVGFTAQENLPSQPNPSHYGRSHQTSYPNHKDPTSISNLNSMNVDEQNIPDCYQTRQRYYRVGSSNEHPSSHLGRPHPTIPPTYSQLNQLQPRQLDISNYRGGIVSYRNCQQCQSLSNGISRSTPANEMFTTQSRNTCNACPYGRNVLTSSFQPQRQVSIRGRFPINTPKPPPSSLLLKSSITGEWIPYYPLKARDKPNSNKLHIQNPDVSSTKPLYGSSLHQDIEPPRLDITSSSSRLNMAALTSRFPLSNEYSNRSATLSYTLDYQRDIPSPQSPESPGTRLFSSNPPPSGVDLPLTYQYEADQTYQRPTPYTPHSYNSLSQNRLDHSIETNHMPTHYNLNCHSSLSQNRLYHPIETRQVPVPYNTYRYNSFPQNRIANPIQSHQITNPYNPNLYNSLGQNRIANPDQTHQVPTYYNPNLYNSLGQNRIANQVPTHQVPASYNPSRHNSLAQNRISNLVQAHPVPTPRKPRRYNSLSQTRRAQRPPLLTPSTRAPLPNTPVSHKPDTTSSLVLRQNKNNQSGSGRQRPDATTTAPLDSALPHYNLSARQPTPIGVSPACIPADPAYRPNDTSVPGEPTNLQTICSQRSATPTPVPSSLVQCNLNSGRETVLKLTRSERSSSKETAGHVVIVLSDDNDSSSNDSHKLVIDYDSVSPRSPTSFI